MAPRRQLPLLPLLRAYAASGLPSTQALTQLPILGPRFAAIRGARTTLLADEFLQSASATDFQTTLVRFYEATVSPPLHAAVVQRRAGLVRHALAHLTHARDPLPSKAQRVLHPGGPYHVPGLGPSFWSAILQGLDLARHSGWTPAIVTGLARLGLARWEAHADPATIYAIILRAGDQIRGEEPALLAQHVDHFLTLVALMSGRDLWSGSRRLESAGPGVDLDSLIRRERTRVPLRRRLKERGRELDEARLQLARAVAECDGPRMRDTLAVADASGARRAPVDWTAHAPVLANWIGRLSEADDPYELLAAFWSSAPVSGAGLWLPAAVLHLKDPRAFLPWSEELRQGYALLDESVDAGASPCDRYRLFNAGAAWLRERHGLHPLEVPPVLAMVGGQAPVVPNERRERQSTSGHWRLATAFGGFCSDTFAFLRELAENNQRDWMIEQRDRYRFAVRQPLVELCRALAERYVDPVLRGTHHWDLETTARSGQALTSVCKNDYGRSQPYQTTLWITFYRREFGGKRDDAQFFVRLDAEGLSFGLRVGREAREAAKLLRRNVQEQAEPLFQALADSGALAECRFFADEAPLAHPTSAADLRAWVAGRSVVVARTLPADHPLLTSDDLVGDILLTFDRLLPAYACAVLSDPLAFLADRCRAGETQTRYTTADFTRATFLSEEWLERARELLLIKKQLILQGVPGTGKTHVARCLARVLTRGREEAVRLVQFHPAYSYEEFVEGIKVKSVEVNGRQDVIYPVEDGLLCAFAAEAERRPSEPFVLVIDEINRGNLPRVFGELLYLLEYREQKLVLPYSRRSFRLPSNLYVLGTMNAADRSVALLDQALRRRFSFLEMPPDARVLSSWLTLHPPTDADFAAAVVRLFETLNERLRHERGPQQQVGHSYFMVPDLDAARLGVVWEHHVRPLIEEYFPGQPERAAGYDLQRLLEGLSDRPSEGRKKRTRSG